jgi:hypothetical protein
VEQLRDFSYVTWRYLILLIFCLKGLKGQDSGCIFSFYLLRLFFSFSITNVLFLF